MSYASLFYLLVFLTVTFIAYTVMPMKYKWTVLLAASLLFYLMSSYKSFVYLAVTTVSVYFGALWIGKISYTFELAKKGLDKQDRKALKKAITRQKKAVVLLMVLINFGLLVYLKYFNFFAGIINSVFGGMSYFEGIPMIKTILPLGISFYTLQAVGYVIDVYRDKYKPCRNFGKLALFVSFFPHIVEGPFDRFGDLADQLYTGHAFDYKRFCFGLQLIVWGLFKKLVIADRLNTYVNRVFNNYPSYAGVYVILAVVCYTIQLYAEFSGAMDIVSGSSELFGVRLARNFERPFFSRSVSEFWRRWHMSLGSWMKDYIFFPVSLSRGIKKFSGFARKHFGAETAQMLPAIFSLFFVWVFCGLWHGAAWKYFVYGMYYYIIMIIGMITEPFFRKLYARLKIDRNSVIYRSLATTRTVSLVGIGMLIFRAGSLVGAVEIFKSMFHDFCFSALVNGNIFNLGLDRHDFAVVALGVILMLVTGIMQEKGICVRQWIAEKNIVLRWTVYFAGVFAVIIFGAYGMGYDPVELIYAQF